MLACPRAGDPRSNLWSAEIIAMSAELSHWLVHVRKDHIIYDEDEPSSVMYRIKKGCVRLQVNGPTGDRQIIAFLFEGDCFGFCLNRRNASAEAVTPVDLVCISIQAILTQARWETSFIVELLEGANQSYGRLAHHLERTAHLNATERVLAFVVEEASRPGRDEPADRLVLRMTRQDIADFLGLEPATVSRALQSLEANGVLTRYGSRGVQLHARALACAVRRMRQMALPVRRPDAGGPEY